MSTGLRIQALNDREGASVEVCTDPSVLLAGCEFDAGDGSMDAVTAALADGLQSTWSRLEEAPHVIDDPQIWTGEPDPAFLWGNYVRIRFHRRRKPGRRWKPTPLRRVSADARAWGVALVEEIDGAIDDRIEQIEMDLAGMDGPPGHTLDATERK